MARPNSTNWRLSGGNPNTDPALSLGGQQGGSTGNTQHTLTPTTSALAGDYQIIDTGAIGDDDHTGKWVVLYFNNDPSPPFIQVTRFTDFDTATGTYSLEAPLEHDFPTAEDGTRGRFTSHNVATDTQQPGNLFGEPTDEQAANGAEIYRCIFFQHFEVGVEWERVHFYIDNEFSRVPSNERYEIAVAGDIMGTITEILADEEDVPDISEFDFGSTAPKFSAPSIGEGAAGNLISRDQPTHPVASSVDHSTFEHRAIWIKRIIDPLQRRATGDGVLAITCEGVSAEDAIGQIRSVGLFPILSGSFAKTVTVRADRGKPAIGADAGLYSSQFDVQAGGRIACETRIALTGAVAPFQPVGYALQSGVGTLFEPDDETDEDGLSRAIYTASKDDGDADTDVVVQARVY